MSEGYEIAHVDELEELPVNNGEFVWRPVRRRFGISAFGTNAYTARAGQRVVEEHYERDGHEGRARERGHGAPAKGRGSSTGPAERSSTATTRRASPATNAPTSWSGSRRPGPRRWTRTASR